jgi:dGTPase
MREQATALKRFLFASLYRHPQVERTTARARQVLRALFEAYAARPQELPEEHRLAMDRRGWRALADYIAGMTDRHAAREYRRLLGAPAFDAG